MKLFNKSNKPYYEFEFEVGDVVEMKHEGEWLVGKIGCYEDEIYFSSFHGGNYYKIYEYKFRQTTNTIKSAKEYYQKQIEIHEYQINHTYDKNQIAYFKGLIKSLPKKAKS